MTVDMKIVDLIDNIKNWKITARIQNKTSVRKFKRNGNETKVFNLDIIDNSGEIRCVIFGDNVEKLYDIFR
ncbi:replication protein A 70 kDa DNA-binding subunit, partial [Aphis craccivora]